MNGGELRIFNKLTEIETKQEERHRENKSTQGVIFKKLKKLDDLKCNVHDERMIWISRWIKIVGCFAIFIFGVISKLHKWW